MIGMRRATILCRREYNEYANYISKKLIPIKKKIQEAYEEDDVDDELIEKLKREKRSIHVSFYA